MYTGRSLTEFVFVVGEQVFRSAANLTISVMLARSVTKEEYGIYVFLFPLIIIILGIQNGLSSTPYVVLSPGFENEKKRSFLSNVFVLHLIVSFVLFMMGCIIGLVQAYLFNFGISAIVVLLYSFAVSAWLLRDFLRQVLLSTLDVKKVFFFGVAVNGSAIVLTGIFYCFGTLNIESTYCIISFSSICPSLVLLYLKRRSIEFERKRFLLDLQKCIRIGKWLVGRALLGLLSGPLILLVVQGDMEEAAVYGVCMIPASLLSPVAQALSTFTVPKLAHAYRHGKENVRMLVSWYTLLIALVLILYNLVVFFSSNEIMSILFGGKYNPSSWLLLLFTLQASVVIFAIPVNSALVAMEDTKSGFIAELIAASIVVSLGTLMVINMGVWGIPIAFLLSSLLGRGYQIYVFNSLLKQKF